MCVSWQLLRTPQRWLAGLEQLPATLSTWMPLTVTRAYDGHSQATCPPLPSQGSIHCHSQGVRPCSDARVTLYACECMCMQPDTHQLPLPT